MSKAKQIQVLEGAKVWISNKGLTALIAGVGICMAAAISHAAKRDDVLFDSCWKLFKNANNISSFSEWDKYNRKSWTEEELFQLLENAIVFKNGKAVNGEA